MKDMPTKERILYSALELISEKGYDGVGVDLIAENAGIKGPSLYRHYKGKEDIFNSMIDMVAAHYEEGFAFDEELVEIPQNMDELIENAMERILFTIHDDILCKIRRILAKEQFRNDRVAEMTTRYHLENLQNFYSLVFEKMIEKGILKQYDPECLALEFVAPVSMLIHIYDRQSERKDEVLEKINRHFEHFVKVYGAILR